MSRSLSQKAAFSRPSRGDDVGPEPQHRLVTVDASALLVEHADVEWLGGRDHPGVDAEVVLEVPADVVVLVADTPPRPTRGGEQDAGVVDAAGGEHERRRLDRERAAAGAADAERRHLAVRPDDDLGDGGVEGDVEVRRGRQLVEATGERVVRGEAEHRQLRAGLPHEWRRLVVEPPSGRVVAGAHADRLMGARVVAVELVDAERPPVVGTRRSGDEVDPVERADAQAGRRCPVARRATEAAAA